MVSVVGDHIDIVSPDKDKQMQKIIIILMTKVSFMMIKCSNCNLSGISVVMSVPKIEHDVA